ncbi:MAG: hypothetical protein AAB493_01260 [Patescibacteria group bacterium]
MEKNKEKEIFQKGAAIIEAEKSGNPSQKYQRGSIQQYNKELEKGGEKSYIKDVLETTKERLPELKKRIEKNEQATFSKTLEDTDPEEFHRQKLEEYDTEEELPKVVEKTEEKKNRIDKLKDTISKLFN